MKKSRVQTLLFVVLNLAAASVLFFPILYAALISLMPLAQLYQGVGLNLIPQSLYVQNYSQAFAMVPLFMFSFNSFFVAVSILVLQLLVAALAAYAFVFMEFRGKQAAFFIILSTMMIPFQSIVLANFNTIARLRLADTYWALILPSVPSAFAIFNLRQSFAGQPKEIKEAADLDACGDLCFLFRIVIPLNRPALASCGILAFIFAWNDYLWPLLVTNSTEMRTVQIGISMMRDTNSSTYGVIMAAVMMALGPTILLFILFQRQLISGLVSGAVKG